MKTITRCFLGLLTLMLLLPACQPKEDVVEEIQLDVSETSLSFAKESAERTITVTTNGSSWSYISPQDGAWLTLTQEGNTLKVKASANPYSAERNGSIVVLAGDKQKRVSVRQSASDFTLDLVEESVSFDSDGGRKQIEFTTNGTVTVEFASEAEWLEVSNITDRGFVATVQKNTERTSRSVKLHVTAGTTIRELVITQEGVMYYVLPLLEVPAKVREILLLEQARGSVVTMLPDDNLNTTYYRVLTKSPIMQLVQYEFNSAEATAMASAAVLCPDRTKLVDNPEFDAFMLENGFTKTSDNTYQREDSRYIFNALVETGPRGAAVEITVTEKQTVEYPTFTTLPLLEQVPWLSFRSKNIPSSKTREEIAAWEAERGSLREEVDATHDKYEIAAEQNAEFTLRNYFFFQKPKPTEAEKPYINTAFEASVITSINRMYWLDAQGNYVLTREFKAFMEANNIHFIRRAEQGGGYYDIFYDAANERGYVSRPYSPTQGDLHVFRVSIDDGSSLSITSTKDEQTLKRNLKKLNDALAESSVLFRK